MIAAVGFKNAYISQRANYDERYQAGSYDQRSYVHVLKAEREALRHAVGRAVASNSRAQTISLFDFGYGTGRVTNEFIATYVDNYAKSGKDLLVVAYDIASAGLQKAYAALCSAGFVPDGTVTWTSDGTTGYIAGRIVKEQAGVTITVVFVHGHEGQPPKVMRRLARAANGGSRFLITTSWYSGLGHVPGEPLRREYFCQLGKLTARRGEIVISVSGTGDLVELPARILRASGETRQRRLPHPCTRRSRL